MNKSAWLVVLVFVAGCTSSGLTGPSTSTGGGRLDLASCNGKPPGQQSSGNPAKAPGNSSSLDHDCKN